MAEDNGPNDWRRDSRITRGLIEGNPRELLTRARPEGGRQYFRNDIYRRMYGSRAARQSMTRQRRGSR